MKKILYLLALTSSFLISSCGEDDCKDDVFGTYMGTENCSSGETDAVLTINQEDQITLERGGIIVTLNSDISSNCEFLNIPGQNVIVNGTEENYNGIFTIKGDTLDGTFAMPNICSYILVRQ